MMKTEIKEYIWTAVLLLVVVVVGMTVVVRVLAWARAVSSTFVDVLTSDMRVDVPIIVSVDLLMDALTDIRIGLLTNIGVDVLVDVNVNVSASVMTAFEFAMSGRPLKEFRC